MQNRRLFGIIAVTVLGLSVVGGAIGVATIHATMRSTLAASSVQSPQTDPPFDTRPCRANPSAATCDGVLPFGPAGAHFSIFERALGSGACYDSQFTAMEEQPIQDANNTTVGDLQLWYAPACKSYTAHLLFEAGMSPKGNSISVEIQQFDGSGISNAFTKFFWNFGNEDPLLPSATEAFGPVQDNEIWSPLLYSPNAPVQALATIDAANGTQYYAPFTGYYAGGHTTTINGKRR